MVLQLFAQNNKKVLIIGIDGCRSDGLIAANTPTIDLLIENGIYSPNALNEDVTSSGPGWSANLCGVWSDKHLVNSNDFTINDYENYPSIFRYVEEFDSELSTVSFCHWGPINDFIIQDFVDFKLNVGTDAEVSSLAVQYLGANDPDLMFLHFDDVDHAGHSLGFDPAISGYLLAIETIDLLLEPIIAAVENRPSFDEEDWVIIVTTDHGGNGTSHGGPSLGEREVFMVVSGNSVEQKLIERDSTIEVEVVENCLNESLELSFDGENDAVIVPANDLYNFGADQDFTIEVRVRTETPGDVAILGNKDWDSGANAGFVFSFKYPSGPEWKVNIGDGTNRVDIDNGGLIADNEWHTLSVSFDRDGMMTMYEDGVFIDEADISGIGDINVGQGLFLGTDIQSGYDYEGKMAEVRVWDTVLEAETIANWFCSPLSSTHENTANLIGYWPMNEGAGNEVIDGSTSNINAEIVDALWTNPDSMLVYDYSKTPRLIDVPVTAMTHMCLPVDASWGLDGKSWLVQCEPSNTTNFDISSVNLYPNPVQETLHITTNTASLVGLLSIENMQGQILHKHTWFGETTLNLSHLQPGMYMISLWNGNEQVSYPFVKQ